MDHFMIKNNTKRKDERSEKLRGKLVLGNDNGFFLGAHTAMAGQEAEAPWALSIGAYASMAPAYSGSDEYELSPGFYADGYLALSEELMILIDGTALALNYQPFKFMDIGLLGSYRKGRDNDDDDTLDGMSDIDDTVEVGPYIGLAFTEHVYLELSTLFDVGDAHKGWIAEAGLSYMDTVGETPLSYQLGIAVRYAGKDLMTPIMVYVNPMPRQHVLRMKERRGFTPLRLTFFCRINCISIGTWSISSCLSSFWILWPKAPWLKRSRKFQWGWA